MAQGEEIGISEHPTATDHLDARACSYRQRGSERQWESGETKRESERERGSESEIEGERESQKQREGQREGEREANVTK